AMYNRFRRWPSEGWDAGRTQGKWQWTLAGYWWNLSFRSVLASLGTACDGVVNVLILTHFRACLVARPRHRLQNPFLGGIQNGHQGRINQKASMPPMITYRLFRVFQ